MTNAYPSDWDKRRKTVYRRDNFQCQNCGRQGGKRGQRELHAHHIVPKSRGGTHQLSNLKTLCSQCHERVHGHSVGGKQTSSQSPKPEITDKRSRLSPEENLYAFTEQVEIYNLIYDLYETIEGAIRTFNEMAEIVFRGERNRPGDESEEYSQLRSKLSDKMAHIEEASDRILDHTYLRESGKYESAVQKVVSSVSEYFVAFEEALENTNTAYSEGTEHFRTGRQDRLVQRMNEIYRQGVWVAGDEALSKLGNECRKARRKSNGAGKSTSGVLLRPLSECPLCENNSITQPFDFLCRCGACRAEWQFNEEYQLQNINGPPEMEGTTMRRAFWEYYGAHDDISITEAKANFERSKELEPYFATGVGVLSIVTFAGLWEMGGFYVALFGAGALALPLLFGLTRPWLTFYFQNHLP